MDAIRRVITEIRASSCSDPSFETNRTLKKGWADALEAALTPIPSEDPSGVESRRAIQAEQTKGAVQSDEHFRLQVNQILKATHVAIPTLSEEAQTILYTTCRTGGGPCWCGAHISSTMTTKEG